MKEVKIGSTHLLIFKTDENFDIEPVEKVIFTLENQTTNCTITKTYPGEVTFDSGFLIPLNQEDTIKLGYKKTSLVDVEGQINYRSKSVGFTNVYQFVIRPSLSYELVNGNVDAYNSVSDLSFEIIGDVVTITADNIDVSKEVQDYLDAHPVTISPEDYQAIANVVLGMLNPSEPVTLVSISAVKTKTSYATDETLTVDDITTTATYSDNSSKVVQGVVDVSNVNMATAGDYTILVSYSEGGITKTTTIGITVTTATIEPTRPQVPQEGYWQFKTTPVTKYFILGTDDSTGTDAVVYRLLRSYRLKYTCNVIADYLDRTIGTDNINGFDNSNDAESLFPNNTTVRNFIATISNNNDVEIALHGKAEHHLVNSNKFTEPIWESVYQSYTNAGGQQTLSDFKLDVLDKIKENDLAQGASYVSACREQIEQAIGDYVMTAGIWGGDGTVTIDGITLDLSALNDMRYDWRENNYCAAATSLVGSFIQGRGLDIFGLQRDSGGFGDFLENYNRMHEGECIELFCHQIDTSDLSGMKSALATIKSYVDQGKATVVTRKEYASLGEYVVNPITSITATRNSTLIVGSTDTDSDYTVTASLLDGTTQTITSGYVIDRTNLDVNTLGTYNVRVLYKGFTVTVSVEVTAQQEEVTTEPSIKSLPTGTISPKFYQGYSLTANGAWDSQTPNPNSLNATSDAYEITITDTITVSTTNGYPFSGFFYGDTPFSRSKKIADITINTGDNVLTIPDGAQYFCLRWHGKSYEFEANIATISITKGSTE